MTIDKEYKICDVLGGLDLTRLISTRTQSLFVSAIDDVEQIREYIAESTSEGAHVGNFQSLEEMSLTLDWKARGLSENATTLSAGIGYTDDRPNRRMGRYVNTDPRILPLEGDRWSDFQMIDSVSTIFPWIVDRKSPEELWWKHHSTGQSEGESKNPVTHSLYTAAWVVSYAGAVMYYPPLNVYGHPGTMGDVVGGEYDPREEPFVVPTLPAENPDRLAVFTKPYPDTAIPGLSLITAAAPIYYSGTFKGNTYNDTYIGATGVDIAVASVSSYLDVLQDTLTPQSFGVLVDEDFSTIVISQEVVRKIYPERTGFEDSRVAYGKDGSIVQDRRNQTYLPSDTILEELTKLDSADWRGLLRSVKATPKGDRSFTNIDIRLTGDKHLTEYHVMFERWLYVADWTLLVFAPKQQVEKAIELYVRKDSDSIPMVVLQGTRGDLLTGQCIVENRGRLDVLVSAKNKPDWIKMDLNETITLEAGKALAVNVEISTDDLVVGAHSTAVVLDVQDADYPDCFFREDLSLPLSIRITQVMCEEAHHVANANGNCVCDSTSFPLGDKCVTYIVLILAIVVPIMFLGIVAAYVHGALRKRAAEDSIWKIRMSDLKFDDPPKSIGGSFGLVLLGEYKGTQVAVKRMRNSGVAPSAYGHTDRLSADGSEDFTDLENNSGHSLEQSRSSHNAGLLHQSTKWAIVQSKFPGILGSGDSAYKRAFIREMRNLSKLRHPAIATVVGAVVNKASEPLLLVMEYMEQGSLYDLIHNETMDFDGEILLKILVDIAHGVQFLHNTEPQIIHGDLRSHNILVDSRFRAKVAGFGAVTRTERHSSSSYWMAPEVLRKESAPTAASDVYSFGIVLYEIYSRKDPYQGEDRKTVLHDICDPLIHKRPIVPLCMKSRVSDIMHDCLVETPEERPSLHEIGNRLRRFDPDHVESVGFVKRTRQVSIDSLMRKFPRRIAEALRDGRDVEPEHHDCVTMCVFDVHGDFSQVLSSEKVTDLVRRLFSQFEELSDFHDVYKVETVGDAWMGVTNLVQKQSDDHVKHMVAFAKDIMHAANETMIDVNNPALGYVQLRIGIHSGPVLANVIGSSNPRFALLGDDVKVAFEMESSSFAGRIQCSDQAATLLRRQVPGIRLQRRESVAANGQEGEMSSYFVE